MTMQYEPTSQAHRRELATAIIAELEGLGFKRRPSAGELVYTRERERNVAVFVYTSIVGAEVRSVGKDALRVSVVYIGPPHERGISKDRAVHRVGTIPAIIGRLRERIESAQNSTLDRCRRCNGPAFLSRGGQPTCAAICWERHVEPVAPAPPARPPAPAVQAPPRPAAPTVETIPVMGRRAPKAPLAVEW
jgi:hypothetical protein